MINNLLDFTDIFNQVRLDERQNIIEHLKSKQVSIDDNQQPTINNIDDVIEAINQLPVGATNATTEPTD